MFQVESLQVNADITTEQFNTIKAKLDKFKDVNEDENENNLKILDSDQEKLVNSDNEGQFPLSIPLLNEPHHKKTCLRGFQPGKTQTGLRSHRS